LASEKRKKKDRSALEMKVTARRPTSTAANTEGPKLTAASATSSKRPVRRRPSAGIGGVVGTRSPTKASARWKNAKESVNKGKSCIQQTQGPSDANPSKFQQLLRDRANEAWNKPLDDAIDQAKRKTSANSKRQTQSAWSEQENRRNPENERTDNKLLDTPSVNDGHRLENMRARLSKNLYSLGITVWSEYSNDFIIIECSPKETVQTLLDKCVRQQNCKPPKFGANLALYTHAEFQKKLPAPKLALAQFNFSQSGAIAPAGVKDTSATLASSGIKDGDGLHVHRLK
jgi:hypothetical protein